MSLDTDHIVDRRRMRRKLTFWRTLAVLIAIAAVIGVATMLRGSSTGLVQTTSPQISRVTIRGIIRGDEDRLKALENLANSRATRAVIVHIDSPGGTTVGSEELHDALRRVANKKPMVVVVDGMAASGGYIAAMAADHISDPEDLARRIDRRAVPVAQCQPPARHHRRQGRGDQIVAAQGRAERARADQRRRRARRSNPWCGTPMPGSRTW